MQMGGRPMRPTGHMVNQMGMGGDRSGMNSPRMSGPMRNMNVASGRPMNNMNQGSPMNANNMRSSGNNMNQQQGGYNGGGVMHGNNNTASSNSNNNRASLINKLPTFSKRVAVENSGPAVTVFVGNITERAPEVMIKQILNTCGPVLSWKRVQGASGKLQG